MELRQLLYFVTVVEEGTISAAARKLNISQPPLSTQIRQLEEEFHITLFERGARTITLTDAGLHLYHYAQEMLELSETAGEDLRALRSGRAGDLRIGVISSLASDVFFYTVRDFHRENPAVIFRLTEANTYQLLEQLRKGKVELAVMRTPYSGKDLERKILSEDTLVAAGRPEDFRGLSSLHQGIYLRDLPDRPLILYRRWEKLIRETMESEGIDPQVSCLNDDARTSLQWAQAGLGIALVPLSVMELFPQLVFAPLKEDKLKSALCLVRRKNHELTQSARKFWDMI